MSDSVTPSLLLGIPAPASAASSARRARLGDAEFSRELAAASPVGKPARDGGASRESKPPVAKPEASREPRREATEPTDSIDGPAPPEPVEATAVSEAEPTPSSEVAAAESGGEGSPASSDELDIEEHDAVDASLVASALLPPPVNVATPQAPNAEADVTSVASIDPFLSAADSPIDGPLTPESPANMTTDEVESIETGERSIASQPPASDEETASAGAVGDLSVLASVGEVASESVQRGEEVARASNEQQDRSGSIAVGSAVEAASVEGPADRSDKSQRNSEGLDEQPTPADEVTPAVADSTELADLSAASATPTVERQTSEAAVAPSNDIAAGDRGATTPPALPERAANGVEGPSMSRGRNPVPTIDPARFVSRVSRAFEAAAERGGGPIRLRLSPPELGSLEIRLEVKDGAMTATIDADTQTARSALLDNLPALRDRLADQQVRVERFDVNVRDNSQGGANPQGDTQQRESWGDSRGRGERSESPRPTASVVAPRPTIDPRFGDGRINVVA